jgi:hypothetical protein
MQAEGPALAPYDYSASWDGTATCPAGGNVAVAATIDHTGDDETGESTIEMVFTQVHNACVVTGSEGTFTLTGNPNLVVDLLLENDGEGLSSFEGDISGGLDWQHDGRDGTCSIAYAFSGTNNLNTGGASWSVSGNVCGVSMQQQFNVG